MTGKRRMLRFDVLVKRHPSMSADEFHHHWTNVHAPLIKHWLQRHGVYRYTQYHTPKPMREQFLGVRDDIKLLDFDGHGEILVPNTDCLKALVEDPYYEAVVKKDEERFLDQASISRTVGYEEVWVRDGEVVEAEEGEGEGGVVKSGEAGAEAGEDGGVGEEGARWLTGD